jgi:hypothetical protein
MKRGNLPWFEMPGRYFVRDDNVKAKMAPFEAKSINRLNGNCLHTLAHSSQNVPVWPAWQVYEPLKHVVNYYL